MPQIKTRTRIFIATSVLSLIYLVLQQVDTRYYLNINLTFDPVKPFVLSLLTYIFCFWVLHFRVSGERYVTVLLFPAISVFALTLLTEILLDGVFSTYGQFGLIMLGTIIFWSLTYVTLLTVNILNVSYIKEIPLGQAGRAAHFVLTLLIAYSSFFLVFSNDIYLVLKIAFIWFQTFLLVYISLWSIKMSKRHRVVAAVDISIMVSLLAFILSLWPINSTYIALVLILIFYVCLGIALEIREIIDRWIWIEYFSVFLIIFVLLFLLAEWGINGHLL